MQRTQVHRAAALSGTLLLTACASFSPEVGPLRAPPIDGGSGGDRTAAPPDGPGPDSAGSTTEAGPHGWTVIVGANGTQTFSPPALTVHAGDTVHWVWQASGHSVTSGSGGKPDGQFCSPGDAQCSSGQTSNTGDTYDHSFSAPGVFPYFCVMHSGMTGTVTAQ